MKFDNKVNRFGLGQILLTQDQESAILTQMDWDRESIPYPVVKEWFESVVTNALTQIQAHHPPCPKVAQALHEGVYARTCVPKRVLK